MTESNPSTASPRPFAAAPDSSRYFPASAMEEARQRTGRSIQRGEGPVLVIGATGLGKTMLLEVVAQQFRDQLRAIFLVGGQLCTRRALLQTILFQLDLPYRDMDESELRLSLLSYLQPQNADPRRILLLVDEADALPARLLEELRVLTNLSAAGQLLINLVLAGNSTLEEQFADPKLDLFSQRISARCYLSAFGRDQTFQYVRAQVAASGCDPDTLFSVEGLEAIFAATDGVPRLINQLGDQLLWMVDETGYSPLDAEIVQQAWSELQQLPAPWNTQSSEPVGVPVEYGELDNDENEFEVNRDSENEFEVNRDSENEFEVNRDSENEFEVNRHSENEFEVNRDSENELEVNQRSDDECDAIQGSESKCDDRCPSDQENHAGEFDEIELDSDCFADDFDDAPASIPINATRSGQSKTAPADLQVTEATGSGSLDVTEQLLEQLNSMDSAPDEANDGGSEVPTGARNPFSEAFDSEEIVLDRYSTFESLLLAEAPRVANCSDTDFAQQLQQFEAIETPPAQDVPGVTVKTEMTKSLAIASGKTVGADCAPQESSLEKVGEVLVIEELEQPETVIVNGQKFRQLFSSLESLGEESCFG